MKKTISSMSILVASLLAVSCQSDSEFMQQESQPMIIEAKAEPVGDAMTRTQMAYGYDVLWNTGDQIYVRNNTANAIFTLQDGAGTPNGTFTCASSPFTAGTQVEAFYPQILVGNSNLVWPATLDKDFVVPMYCKQTLTAGSTQNLRFKSLGGILQIVFVKNMQIYPIIKSVKVEDGTQTLSGTFTIDSEGKAVITATDKAGITLNTGFDKTLGWGACIINIALPAGTYNSLKLTFTDNDGRVLERTVGESVTISQNNITKLNVLGASFHDISPSTGYAKATINGQEVDVPWVRLWWKGPKFAAFNIGVTDGQPSSMGCLYNWGGVNDRREYRFDTNSSDCTGKLSSSDDTATRLWGSNWRMPTLSELKSLADYCTYAYETLNDINGFRFTTKNDDYHGNSIFLPLGGYINGAGLPFYNNQGFYWSSDNSAEDDVAKLWADGFSFYLDGPTYTFTLSSADLRCNGYSVRAVLKE